VATTHVATQIQEEVPAVRPVVRAFRVHVGSYRACGRRVQGRHPLQTSDALGAASTHLGPQATTLVVWWHKGLGLPLGKVQRVLRTQCGLRVTRGGLAHLCARVATRAAPTYAALCAEVRQSPMVSPDETGWKIGRVLHWLWVAATPTTTVYRIAAGRGFDDAAALLGANFAGVLVRDGWAPYRRFTHATYQTCLAHLLRRCRLLHLDHPRSRLPRQKETLAGSGGDGIGVIGPRPTPRQTAQAAAAQSAGRVPTPNSARARTPPPVRSCRCPSPPNPSTFRHRLRAGRCQQARAEQQINTSIGRHNLQATLVYRYLPPFGTVQVVYQRGTAAYGQPSDQGHTLFVKATTVF
jgi:hypothetical protein